MTCTCRTALAKGIIYVSTYVKVWYISECWIFITHAYYSDANGLTNKGSPLLHTHEYTHLRRRREKSMNWYRVTNYIWVTNYTIHELKRCTLGGVPTDPAGHMVGSTHALKLVLALGAVYQEGHGVHVPFPAVDLMKFLKSQLYSMSYGKCRNELTFENSTLYVFSPHFAHAATPGSVAILYLPATHCVQGPPSGPAEPAWQGDDGGSTHCVCLTTQVTMHTHKIK